MAILPQDIPFNSQAHYLDTIRRYRTDLYTSAQGRLRRARDPPGWISCDLRLSGPMRLEMNLRSGEGELDRPSKLHPGFSRLFLTALGSPEC